MVLPQCQVHLLNVNQEVLLSTQLLDIWLFLITKVSSQLEKLTGLLLIAEQKVHSTTSKRPYLKRLKRLNGLKLCPTRHATSTLQLDHMTTRSTYLIPKHTKKQLNLLATAHSLLQLIGRKIHHSSGQFAVLTSFFSSTLAKRRGIHQVHQTQ